MLNYLILHLMSDKMTLSNFLIMNIYRHRKTRPEIIKWSSTSTYTHPTTGYLDNRSYRELRSHGMTGRNFFDVFLPFYLLFKRKHKFLSYT